MSIDDKIAPEELKYGIDITGLDPASLTDALRAVITDVTLLVLAAIFMNWSVRVPW